MSTTDETGNVTIPEAACQWYLANPRILLILFCAFEGVLEDRVDRIEMIESPN